MNSSADFVPNLQESFGVGALLSRTFSAFFANLLPIIVISFPVQALAAWLVGLSYDLTDSTYGQFAIELSLGVVASAIVTALITPLIFDAELGRPRRYGDYARLAVRILPTLVMVSAVITFLAAVGFAALIIPGLFILTVYFIATPTVVIERAGMGALTRSSELTRGYRWPLFGVFLVLVVCAILIGGVVGFVIGVTDGWIRDEHPLLIGLVNTLSEGLISVSAVIAYARLRELKEGLGVEQIVSVFD